MENKDIGKQKEKVSTRKTKVWKDVDKVIRAATIPKKDKWIVEIMEEIPKNEKSS